MCTAQSHGLWLGIKFQFKLHEISTHSHKGRGNKGVLPQCLRSDEVRMPSETISMPSNCLWIEREQRTE